MSEKRARLADREKTRSPRPIETLFQPTVEKRPEKKKKNVIRQSYYMEPDLVEALRILDFRTRKGISVTLNEILRAGIDKELLEEAEKNLKEREDGR